MSAKETVLCDAAISENWQVAIRAAVRPHLGVKRGDRLEYVLRNGDVIVRKAGEKQ